MRLSKKLLSFVFLAALLMWKASNLHAQTDYVITNDGVKIMGEVKTHNVDKVKFKAVGEEKMKKYKPKEIKEAYKAGHGVFRSVYLPKNQSQSFLQVLEDGKIKLYEYYKSSGTMYGMTPMAGGGYTPMGMYNNTKKAWYAQKDSSEVVEVKSNQIWGSRQGRKDNFLRLIQDNQHIADRYNAEDKFNFDFVRSLIVEYNGLVKN